MTSNEGLDLMGTIGSLNEVVGSLRTTLAAIRRSAKDGTLDNAEVMAAIDEAIGSDDDDSKPENVAAERRPLHLVAESGLPVPGDYVEILQETPRIEPLSSVDFVPGDHLEAESPAEKLVKLLTPPQGGISAEAGMLLAEAQGNEVSMAGSLPIPTHDSLSLEQVRAALVVAKGGKQAQKFSGEVIGNMPVPL